MANSRAGPASSQFPLIRRRNNSRNTESIGPKQRASIRKPASLRSRRTQARTMPDGSGTAGTKNCSAAPSSGVPRPATEPETFGSVEPIPGEPIQRQRACCHWFRGNASSSPTTAQVTPLEPQNPCAGARARASSLLNQLRRCSPLRLSLAGEAAGGKSSGSGRGVCSRASISGRAQIPDALEYYRQAVDSIPRGSRPDAIAASWPINFGYCRSPWPPTKPRWPLGPIPPTPVTTSRSRSSRPVTSPMP